MNRSISALPAAQHKNYTGMVITGDLLPARKSPQGCILSSPWSISIFAVSDSANGEKRSVEETDGHEVEDKVDGPVVSQEMPSYFVSLFPFLVMNVWVELVY